MQCRACYQQTSVPPVNWTVTMINQRRLPPMLLTSPHITPPVHHHGRKPPRGWTQGFQTAEVTSKVTKGHPYWCHSIGHVRFPISLQLQLCVYLSISEILPLISQNLKRSRDPEDIPFGGNLSRVR